MECVQECCYEVPIILCLTEVNVCREGGGRRKYKLSLEDFIMNFVPSPLYH